MKSQLYELNEDLNHNHHFICWKSLIAGFLVSLLSYFVLTAMGAGIGGMVASNLISHEESGSGLATGAGVWLGLSAAISLFIGSYFCLRLARFVTPKVGTSHGIVLASLFFILMVWGIGTGLSSVASGLGRTVLSASNGVTSIISNPAVQDTLQRSLGNSQLKSSPKEVIEGLALRLMQGNMDSAKSYLAFQSGLSELEVDQRMTQLRNDFEQNAKIAGETTAQGVAAAGWSLFLTLLVGIGAAIMGALMAVRSNARMPMVEQSYTSDRTSDVVPA